MNSAVITVPTPACALSATPMPVQIRSATTRTARKLCGRLPAPMPSPAPLAESVAPAPVDDHLAPVPGARFAELPVTSIHEVTGPDKVVCQPSVGPSSPVPGRRCR